MAGNDISRSVVARPVGLACHVVPGETPSPHHSACDCLCQSVVARDTGLLPLASSHVIERHIVVVEMRVLLREQHLANSDHPQDHRVQCCVPSSVFSL